MYVYFIICFKFEVKLIIIYWKGGGYCGYLIIILWGDGFSKEY